MKNVILVIVSCLITYWFTKSEEKAIAVVEKKHEDSVLVQIKKRHSELSGAIVAGDQKVTEVIDKAASTITTLKGKVEVLTNQVNELKKGK